MGTAPASAPLLRRIVRETAWFAIVQAAAAVLAWVTQVALSRMLERHDFGVYGICAVYVGIGSLLGDGGLGAALLRREGEVTAAEYRVTLTVLLGLAAVFSGGLLLAAPWIAAKNHMSAGDTRVLQAMSPLFLIGALRFVPYVRLGRQLKFAQIARVELASSLVRHALALSIAWMHGGVWALVVSNNVGALVQLGLAYRAAPGWVGLGFSWRTLRPLIGYGSKVQALGLCGFLKDNVSGALLGATLGPSAVALFGFGLSYIETPVNAVNNLARVQLPVFSQLQPTDPALFRTLRGALRVSLLLGLPVLASLALAAPWIIPVVYDPKWTPALPVVWGLLANMAAGLVASPLFTLLQGQGRAGLAVWVFAAWTTATWGLAIAAVLLAPGSLGMVALAHSVVTVIAVGSLVYWAGRHLSQGLFSSLGAPIAAGLLGLVAGALVARYGTGMAGHPLVAAGASLLVYVLALLLLQGRTVIEEAKGLWTSTRKSRVPARPIDPAVQPAPVSVAP